MPGVHTYLQYRHLNLIIYTNPWPRIMDSAVKRKVNWTRRMGRHCRPVLQLPTGQSCSLQTWCYDDDDPGAHGHERGKQKQNERGKQTERGQMMRAVGMAGKG